MPIRATLTLRAHHTSDFHAVVVRFCNFAHEGPVPRIPVAPLRKYRRDFLERTCLRSIVAGSSHVTPNNEGLDDVRATAKRNVCQDLVKLIGDILAAGIVDDAPVLPQDAEIE